MNEQDSVYFEEGEDEKEEPFLPELHNHQFEQETPIINHNRKIRQYEKRPCEISKKQKIARRRISPERIQEMIHEKNQGASLRSIIKKFKVDKNTLYKYNVTVKKYNMGFLLNLEEKLKKIFQSHANCSCPRERFQKTPSIPATILSSSFVNGTFHCFNRKSEQPQNSLKLLNNQLTEFLSKKKFEIIDQRNNGFSIQTICKNFKTTSATLYKYHVLNKRKYTNRRFSVKNTLQTPDRLPGIETLKEFMIPVSSYSLRRSTLRQKLYYKI